MNKIPIKVIKRKDAVATTAAKTPIAGEAGQLISVNKKDRRLHLEIVETVSNWIPARNKNNRAEEIDAVRKFFGSEQLLSKI